ncbi:condensation domain-containing protein [uncultured Sphaerochaeta sp.]|uniref:condensation domain-containing protein n=1 Tax=uncultured Sphaerochaeta sp. TaxID=886478 RepID=UPI002A0A4078|nr:condensation domain-containing protein [uncultured Sphaerochaeta sp.]
MESEILFERTHLFSPSINVAVMIDIKGRVDFIALEMAIAKAVSANEILHSRIQLDAEGRAFYCPMSKGRYSFCVSEESWETVVVQQSKISFDLESGELIRFFALPGKETIRLVIIAHHLAGDGLSIVFLVEDIMKSLAGKTLEEKPICLLSPSSLENVRFASPLIRFMLNVLNRKWEQTGKVFSFSDYRRMFNHYWVDRQLKVLCHTIQAEVLGKLVKYSKEWHLTLNSILATICFKAEGKAMALGMAASVRPEGYRGMGNYASGITIKYCYHYKKSFHENALAVQKQIQAKTGDKGKLYFLLRFLQALSPTLVDAAYFAAYDGYSNKTASRMQAMFGYKGKPRQVGLSNLMRIPIEEKYGPYHLSSFCFVPPLVPNNSKILGIATLGTKLELSLAVGEGEALAPGKAFFDRVIQELTEIQ